MRCRSTKAPIKIQFTQTCYGNTTKLTDIVEAKRAAREYSRLRGYQCEAFWCAPCERFHVRPLDPKKQNETQEKNQMSELDPTYDLVRAPKRPLTPAELEILRPLTPASAPDARTAKQIAYASGIREIEGLVLRIEELEHAVAELKAPPARAS